MSYSPCRIIAENSARRRRSLLATTGFNHTTITLEFGDPPAPNITAPPPPTVAQEIMMAGETNDSVDLEVSLIHRGMESSVVSIPVAYS